MKFAIETWDSRKLRTLIEDEQSMGHSQDWIACKFSQTASNLSFGRNQTFAISSLLRPASNMVCILFGSTRITVLTMLHSIGTQESRSRTKSRGYFCCCNSHDQAHQLSAQKTSRSVPTSKRASLSLALPSSFDSKCQPNQILMRYLFAASLLPSMTPSCISRI